MSLIARVLQPVDFQCIPVTCKPKTDVTHVTRTGKWHQWHRKNKHMSPGSAEIQTIMLPVQWVTWVYKPFFNFPLAPLSKCHPEHREESVGINQCLADSRRRIKKTPSRFLKTSATFPDFSSTIFNSWRSVVPRNYLLHKILKVSIRISTRFSNCSYEHSCSCKVHS